MTGFKYYHLMVMLTIAGFAETNPTYFDYSMDCPGLCVSTNESCTIREDGEDFIKLCYVQGKSCVDRASDEQVCLQVNGRPIGGEAIWETYRRKYYPNKNTCICSNTGLIISIIVNCITAIIIIIKNVNHPCETI